MHFLTYPYVCGIYSTAYTHIHTSIHTQTHTHARTHAHTNSYKASFPLLSKPQPLISCTVYILRIARMKGVTNHNRSPQTIRNTRYAEQTTSRFYAAVNNERYGKAASDILPRLAVPGSPRPPVSLSPFAHPPPRLSKKRLVHGHTIVRTMDLVVL